jgi:hypothetical protein
MEFAGLKSRVDPILYIGGKVIKFNNSGHIVLSMQESGHGNDPTTSTYGHTGQKDAIT